MCTGSVPGGTGGTVLLPGPGPGGAVRAAAAGVAGGCQRTRGRRAGRARGGRPLPHLASHVPAWLPSHTLGLSQTPRWASNLV